MNQQTTTVGQPVVASQQQQERDQAAAALRAARNGADSQEMQGLCRLLRYRLEEAKSTLLRCQPDEFAAVQARARVYMLLLKEVFNQ